MMTPAVVFSAIALAFIFWAVERLSRPDPVRTPPMTFVNPATVTVSISRNPAVAAEQVANQYVTKWTSYEQAVFLDELCRHTKLNRSTL